MLSSKWMRFEVSSELVLGRGEMKRGPSSKITLGCPICKQGPVRGTRRIRLFLGGN